MLNFTLHRRNENDKKYNILPIRSAKVQEFDNILTVGKTAGNRKSVL